jgi:hypothetical protein
MRNRFSTAGTARLDRGFAGQEPNRWLRQVAGNLRLAIDRRIPIAFEDETGFHFGVQPEGIFVDDEQF